MMNVPPGEYVPRTTPSRARTQRNDSTPVKPTLVVAVVRH